VSPPNLNLPAINFPVVIPIWAKALRQEATRHQAEVGAELGW
jgi:hypothetical protein